ncbi:ABC transporter ATP-binding protein [Anaerococcus sp. mt242]|uniref:ABC transporter ATP-binding protein n=1 Tax=Anaerococcus sp. mt242 TaxID=2661917 RepID=UPI001933CDDF|nr:ABC transporter ATP-binding protein [Anaerococcus sp. mt242]MBM0045779.1 ABC transporter ATP-binding protein [Anaerococcus sp. mt242]
MFKNFSWFFKYAKRNYIIGSISLVLSDIISLFLPYVTGKIIDLVYTGNLTMDKFIQMIAISFILIILKYVTAIGWSFNIFKASALMEYTSRDMLMSKFLKQSQRFFENNPTGSLMSKSTQDVSQVAQFAGFGLLAFFDAALFPIFIVAMMVITIDFKMTIYAVLPFIALGFGLTRIMKKIYKRSKEVNKSFDDLTDEVLEDVQGIRIIRVYNIGNLREQRFNKKARELANNNVDLERIRAIIEPFERVLTSLSYVIAVGYGSYLISKGALSVGKLVSFTYYLNMLIWPMFAVGEFLNLHQQASAAMDRILEILNYKEEIKISDNKKVVDYPLDITFVNHFYKYPSSNELALNNLNLNIKNGSSIGIIGKTGSGKTTLIRQLLDIYKVDKDSIIIGTDYFNEVSAKSFKDKIGYVPQRHMIFSDTILNNIKFSNPYAKDEEVKKAIEIADFTKDVNEFSDGLGTLTGEKGVSLSGGQKQRLAIARAVLSNPQILILDDAMSAVDANTEQNIINNLIKIREDKTTIIIAHRISQVQNCDQIIVLDEGKIVDQGNHQSLMSRDTWYKKQYENQISGGSLND